MKKIAFIMKESLSMPPVNGGAVQTLVDCFVNSANAKFDIDVYSFSSSENTRINNVNYYYVSYNGIFDKFEKFFRFVFNKLFKKYIGNLYIKKLVRKYNFSDYDYVIVENKPDYGLILRKYVGGKLILHCHNEICDNYKKRFDLIMDYYDEFFLVSKYMFNNFDVSVKNKIKLLYNGVDVNRFNISIDKKVERSKWGFSESDFVFLYTGRLIPKKGVLELVKAFNNINDSNYKLLIVGSVGYGSNVSNSFTDELKDLCIDNPNIVFTGFLSYSDINKVYSIADYGVVPSIWNEPFGLTVIEHLASGHPIITVNTGAIPELVNSKCSIVIENDCDFVVNLTNEIYNIVNKGFDSKDCIKQARKFSCEKYIDRFLELLECGEE